MGKPFVTPRDATEGYGDFQPDFPSADLLDGWQHGVKIAVEVHETQKRCLLPRTAYYADFATPFHVPLLHRSAVG